MFTELKDLMQRYGVNQIEIAEKTGVSRTLVNLILNGKRNDKRGVVELCIKKVEEAQREELKRSTAIERRIERLTSASANVA